MPAAAISSGSGTRGADEPPGGVASSQRRKRQPLDCKAAEELIAHVVAGEHAAWPSFVELIVPELYLIIRTSRKMGPLRDSADHRMNVVTETLEKLSRNGHRSLATFEPWRDANAGKSFADWLRIVTTNVARDYVVRQLGSRRDVASEAPSAQKRMLHTLATALPGDDLLPGRKPNMTDAQTARMILELARVRLDPKQLAALELWLRGAGPAEIAKAIGVDIATAKRLVHSGLAKLRREFAET